MSADEPTDEMPGGAERPTEVTPRSGDEPTGVLPEGNEEKTGVLPEDHEVETGVLPGGEEPPAGPHPVAGSGGGNRGIGVLVASIVASLALVGAYIVAGGLDYGPDKAADPCDARPWTDPQDLEEAAQQFALSAADGAACELGVSREELTRAIASDESRQEFMDEEGISDAEMEDALRAGLNRAVDDAENAGVLGGLAATGIRAAIQVMPMSVMIDLLENADSIFTGDLGGLGGLGGAIDAITGGLDEFGSGTTDDPLEGLGGALEGALPEGTTDALEGQVPDDLQQQIEDEAMKQLEQGLDGLLNP